MRRFELRYDRWIGWLLGLFGTGRRFSHVEVDPDAATVEVRMGWAFHAVIPVRAISTVGPPVRRPFFSIGVHGWRGWWLVNGSMRGLVAIEIDPVVRARVMYVPVRLRTLVLSLADPDAFAASVRERQERW